MTTRQHFNQLDSLRGLAAFCVMFGHWVPYEIKAAFPNVRSVGSADFQVIGIPLIGNLANGHSAVVLFFIMSGFVLSLPQLRGKPVNYPTYIIKRICRIYLPYLVALGIAVIGCYFFYSRLHGTADGTWDQGPSPRTIVQSLLMVTSYDAMHYNGAFWSIIEEMRISLVFPAVCWFFLSRTRTGATIAAVIILILSAIAERLHLPLGRTLGYVVMFAMGILLSKHRVELMLIMSNLTRRTYYLIFAASLAIYQYGPTIQHFSHLTISAADAFTGIGASGLLLFSLHNETCSNFLSMPIPRFLGRISYSMYLLHGTILLTFVVLFAKYSPVLWLAPFLTVSILAAWAMYTAVEAPAISLGGYLTRLNVMSVPKDIGGSQNAERNPKRRH